MSGYRSIKSIGARAVVVALALVVTTSCGKKQDDGQRATLAAAPARRASSRIVNVPGTAISLTAQRMATALRDGTPAPMWGYCESSACASSTTWAPGPTIVARPGESLQINLTNQLPVATSLAVLGQLGGGLGAPQKMDGPAHLPQNNTTFPGNGAGPAPFVPPAQSQRVRSFGTEVPAAVGATPGTATLTWNNLQPGTYLYETGTAPSLQVPMGLYGVLIVTTAPAAGVAGAAYPGVSYDDDVALLFSELDPAQNKAVDDAAQAGTALTLRFNDPSCSHLVVAGVDMGPKCYPAAVNYMPTYFFINGQSFDRTAPEKSAFLVGSAWSTGNLLVRLLNAGSRTHVPSLVGLPMSLVAEDGNRAPGNPKVQNEVLLTAGKTHDALVRPAAGAAGKYAPATVAVFDRSLSLSTANHSDGGMQAFLLVNHADAASTTVTTTDSNGVTTTTTVPVAGAPGNLPVALTPSANADSFNVPYNTSISGDVTANDVGIARVALGSGPSNGTLSLNPNGTFTYAPTAGYSGADSFAYYGNGNPALSAVVSLNVAVKLTGATNMPVALADSYTSSLTSKFSTPRPGVLANDTDPNKYPLSAQLASGGTCGAPQLGADGSFTLTAPVGTVAGGSCTFSYTAVNSQGNASAPATVTVTFGKPGTQAGLSVSVVDASSLAAVGDYRWTLQEDLTFKTDVSRNPSVTTRTIGTSFHRSHMTVVATGCVGPVSCGSGQTKRDNDGAKSSGAITAVGESSGTVTVTTSAPHGLADGTLVQVAGLDPAFYNGAWAISPGATPNQFTYQVTPPTPGPPTATPSATWNNAPNGTLGERHVVSDTEALQQQTLPGELALDPAKSYYISVLPGDGSPPGHAMGGAQVKAGGAATVKVQATPLPPSQLSIYIYDDSAPTNGQNDTGEAGLGGFNIILFDPAGRTGDPAGQQTYDQFNYPLSNALLGSPGCPDELNKGTNGTAQSVAGHLVGAVYTCPNAPPGWPASDTTTYALAGHALIKNLTPARYDVIAHPGAEREGAGEVWWQTETLEGTAAQDAFVGVNEPIYFQEFGPPGPHTTVGFVNPDRVAASGSARGLGTGATVTGKVTSNHMSHPSDVTLHDSGSYGMLFSTTCRVVLNSQAGIGPAVAAAECDADGNFVLTGVPAGAYDLAVFDQWLDQIIQNVAVTVPPSTTAVSLGNIPVLSWFTQYDQNIYQDLNKNGVYDVGEPGISNVPLSVRFRNGAPSNSTLSDSAGNGILVELFPLFNWYVAEADTTRFKQTGVHVWVDGGGTPDAAGPGAGLWSSTYAYPPDGTTERSYGAGVLSLGVQSFISQRNRVDWGRTPYAKGENGGIVGTVVYSSTRAFDDMRFNVQTLWEPLVPRVTANLYRQETLADGTQTLTLVDTTLTSSFDDFVNLVKGADGQPYQLSADGTLRDASGAAAGSGAYPAGVQLNLQCPGQDPADVFVNYTLGSGDRQRCYDGWHNWNQVQPAPYDGRYVFPSAAYVAAHPLCSATVTTNCTTPSPGQTLVSLPPATYVVEAVTPPGYEVVKEEDKNILIGDAFVAPASSQFGGLGSIFILPDQATLGNVNPYAPNTGDPGVQSDPTTNLGVYGLSNATTFPECVGALHRVPDYLSLYPQAQQVAPFAGMDRPLCDRKKTVLNDQMQASAVFYIFTETPAASNNTGIILDDASSEFNAASPDFGEKASVPFVPVSIKDYRGTEISRVYSDQWGAYNVMTPSSWLVNPPTPSGYGPNMMVTCINDPGPISRGGQLITDPSYNPAYSNFCYTTPYMPGTTTYLDTPVVPIAAFASGYNPPDCAMQDLAPAIKRVDGAAPFGPWLPAAGGTLTITALGDQLVPNPAYAGPFADRSSLSGQPSILRHYGFGTTKGTVKIGSYLVPPNAITEWTDGEIKLTVPANAAGGELSVTTATGLGSIDAVTVTIGGKPPTYVSGAMGQTIQDAVDHATPGDLILIDAGTYNELVIMWQPVRLQGVGAGAVIINAAKYPTSKLANWRPRINQLFGIDAAGNRTLPAQVDPLPTQEITGGAVLLEPSVLGTEEGAGITVLGKNVPSDANGVPRCDKNSVPFADSNYLCAPSRIDGISVTGGDAGGGIYVNGWAHNLEISNNRVYGNAGAYNGGIRVGVPYLELADYVKGPNGTVDQYNNKIPGFGLDTKVFIHHNQVSRNGTVEAPTGSGGAGGGISMCTGSDYYRIENNLVCGNFSNSDGGGIGHLGFSQGGTIAHNQILFNQSFQQTNSTHGGGIAVIGEPAITFPVSLGTGDLIIDANLIRGNFAEAGSGGGIRLQRVNGLDVYYFYMPTMTQQWNTVTITNNMIANNVAGYAGGGLSMSDAVKVVLDNNTVASNDSVGIAGAVLAGGGAIPGRGQPAPSGVASEPTSSPLLQQFFSDGQRRANAISNPVELANNILWKNRSFFYSGDGRLCAGNNTATGAGCTVLGDQSTSGQCVANAAYWDAGVLGDTSAALPGTWVNTPPAGTVVRLAMRNSILTSLTGYTGTGLSSSDPLLAGLTCNGSRVVPELGGVINPPSSLTLQVAATVDEGNNYVNLRYGPLYTVNPSSGAPVGNYHIGAASPAINTGFTVVAPAANVTARHDFDGDARPQGTAYDIGADEFSVASAAPTALAFGTVQVGAPSDPQTVTLTNNGQGQLTFTSVTFNGANAADFTQSNTCAGGVAGNGGTCAITVTFTPGGVGGRSATMTINDSAGAQTVSLTGTGVAPSSSLSPASFNFGNQPVGTSSAPALFTFTNTGIGRFTVTLPISGGNAANYLVGSGGANPCASLASGILAAGASCTFGVTFTPNAVGSRTTNLTATGTSGAATAPQVAGLSGTGVRGSVTYSPSPVAFGNVALNSTNSRVVTATVSNFPVTFGALTNSGAPFGVSGDNCSGTVVGAGNSCTFTVTYHPTAYGANSGTVTVPSNQGANPQTVNLTGTAARGTVAYSSGAFPNTAVGATASRVITATVSGFPVTFGAVGSPAAPFGKSGSDSCSGQTFAAGTTCTFTVTFTPTTNAASTSSLSVPSNANGNPQTVAVSGRGVSPAAITASAPAFPATKQGTIGAVQIVLTITNPTGNPAFSGMAYVPLGGGSPGDWSYQAASGTGNCGASIAAGVTCNVRFRFNPAARAGLPAAGVAETATVTPSSTAVGATFTGSPVTLSGMVTP